MNRERLTILRDHLASLPDERFDMSTVTDERSCGTVACIAGWAWTIFGGEETSSHRLGLTDQQFRRLCMPADHENGRDWHNSEDYTRSDAIAAIQSMLDNPDDDALPVWPEVSL